MENPFMIGKEINLEKRIKIMKEVEQDSAYAEKRAGEMFRYSLEYIKK